MIWLALLLVLPLAFLVYGFRPYARWQVRHIPGPAPAFLLGSMGRIQKLGSHILHLQYAKKYGGIFKTFGPGGPAIVVTSPELVRQVLLKNPDRIRFPTMNISKESQEFDYQNILAARGDHWRSLRAAWSPIFFTGSLENYSEGMNASAKVFVERLGEASQSGEPVEVWRLIGDLTLDVVGGTAFGVDLNTQRPPADITSEDAQRAQQLREDCAQFFRGFGGITSTWFLLVVVFPELAWVFRQLATYFPDKKMMPQRDARKRLIAVTRTLIDRHRAALAAQHTLDAEADGAKGLPNGTSKDLPNGTSHALPNGVAPADGKTGGAKTNSKAISVSARPGIYADLKKGVHPGSFLDILVRGKDRNGKPFTDVAISAQVFLMLLAGYETTANTLAFCLYNMARSPACQERLAAEAAAYSGDPLFEDLGQFPYADACLRETLRLFPPGAVGLREAARDMVLGGYSIRKGQTLIASFYPLHRDESIWKSPEEFIPERWLEGNPDTVPEEMRKGAWAAFGDGPRQCPGYRFALEEARIALVHIFRAYSFRLAPGQEPLALRNNVTLCPKDGVRLFVHKRG